MTATLALAIDPGTRKCGVAVVQSEGELRTLYREVTPTQDLPGVILRVCAEYAPHVVLIGNATNARVVADVVRALLPAAVPVEFVPEAFSSERARARWCLENPPVNLWERLLPGFRTPNVPVDDYAAVILAEQYFASQS